MIKSSQSKTMIYIYCTHIKDIQWEKIQTYLNILNQADQKNITQYKFNKDKCRSLVGKMLLLHIIKKHEDYYPRILPAINYTRHKKPFIMSMQGHFNISHAEDWVVCVYTRHGEIGIDIEKKHIIDLSNYKAIMTSNEYLRATHNHDFDFDFFQLWTLKEAIMKAEGLGFYLSPTSFEIPAPFTNNTSIHLSREWFLYNQTFEQHYALSVASTCILNTPPQLITESIETLMKLKN